jgi:hypothetical protein
LAGHRMAQVRTTNPSSMAVEPSMNGIASIQ